MNIQPINQQTNNNIGFQKLIVKKGSFNVLRNSEYFPEKSYPDYYKNLKSFCKKMTDLKKDCEKNEIYNSNMKALGLHNLVLLYVDWKEKKETEEASEAEPDAVND